MPSMGLSANTVVSSKGDTIELVVHSPTKVARPFGFSSSIDLNGIDNGGGGLIQEGGRAGSMPVDSRASSDAGSLAELSALLASPARSDLGLGPAESVPGSVGDATGGGGRLAHAFSERWGAWGSDAKSEATVGCTGPRVGVTTVGGHRARYFDHEALLLSPYDPHPPISMAVVSPSSSSSSLSNSTLATNEAWTHPQTSQQHSSICEISRVSSGCSTSVDWKGVNNNKNVDNDADDAGVDTTHLLSEVEASGRQPSPRVIGSPFLASVATVTGERGQEHGAGVVVPGSRPGSYVGDMENLAAFPGARLSLDTSSSVGEKTSGGGASSPIKSPHSRTQVWRWEDGAGLEAILTREPTTVPRHDNTTGRRERGCEGGRRGSTTGSASRSRSGTASSSAVRKSSLGNEITKIKHSPSRLSRAPSPRQQQFCGLQQESGEDETPGWKGRKRAVAAAAEGAVRRLSLGLLEAGLEVPREDEPDRLVSWRERGSLRRLSAEGQTRLSEIDL